MKLIELAGITMPTDHELKEKELALKSRELDIKAEHITIERRKIIWWSAPLTVAVVAGIIALFANGLLEWVKGRNAQDVEILKSALDLVNKAAQIPDTEARRKYLVFIIDIEFAPPELTKKLSDYLKRQPDGPLPPSTAIVTEAAPSSAITPAIPAVQPGPTPTANLQPSPKETGWFYMGKFDPDKKVWADSSGLGSFEIPPTGPVSFGQSLDVASLPGKTIRTLSTKYLRDVGTPGQRVSSPIKGTLKPGTSLKIIKIDDLGRDGGLPVLWAEVEVQT